MSNKRKQPAPLPPLSTAIASAATAKNPKDEEKEKSVKPAQESVDMQDGDTEIKIGQLVYPGDVIPLDANGALAGSKIRLAAGLTYGLDSILVTRCGVLRSDVAGSGTVRKLWIDNAQKHVCSHPIAPFGDVRWRITLLRY